MIFIDLAFATVITFCLYHFFRIGVGVAVGFGVAFHMNIWLKLLVAVITSLEILWRGQNEKP